MRTSINAFTDFARILNPDGTPQSICLHCFATVSPLAESRDVRLSEDAHLCWQGEEAGPLIDLAVN
jgi:hypothetical protein